MKTGTENNGTGWAMQPFPECLDDLGMHKPGKLFARDYKPTGIVPVVDQGQEFIAGWTNDEALAIRKNLPFIVFGDHTRAFKFVNFPFALGADGTQLLKPKPDFNPRFFYYACLHLPLPNRGYNRHFTVLKEQSLPLPPKPQQEKIAAVLLKIQQAIEVEIKLIACARELKQSTMHQLFTQGLRKEPQKETETGLVPQSWEPKRINELGEVVTGTTPPTAKREYYDGGNIPFIAPGDLGDDNLIRTTVKKITEAGLDVSRTLPKNTVCFVCIGSTIGKIGITVEDRSASNQQINAVIANDAHNPLYACYLLAFKSEYIASFSSPSPVPIMSKGIFGNIALYVSPDKNEQSEIAAILQTIDQKIAVHERKRAALSDLFQTLLHQLMTAQIRVDKLDIDTSEVTA